jgi:hypothetical protein
MTSQRLDDLPDVMRLWPDAGRFLGLGRNATFDAAKRGELPVLRFGRRLLVSKVALVRLLAEGRPESDPQAMTTRGAPLPLRRRVVP